MESQDQIVRQQTQDTQYVAHEGDVQVGGSLSEHIREIDPQKELNLAVHGLLPQWQTN